MNWTRRTAFALVAAAAFVVGLVSGTTHAAPAEPVFVAPPEAGTFDNVIDAEEMETLIDLTERIQPYLSLDADGLVQLDPAVTAADLGVTDEFLATYRESLAESNKLIERGEITVDADMRVTMSDHLAASFREPQPGKGGNTDAAAPGEPVALDDEAVPDWSCWRYNSGAMFYNSYNTYSTYRNNYYGLCNTMASYMGCSRCAPSLQYFYGYNGSYLNSYCYRNSGVYYYLPYSNSNGCGSSYGCYGNLSYKPAYYWGYGRSYNNSCRCYQNQWQWYGNWCRY